MHVELPILGLLHERPRHGYELKGSLEKMLGRMWKMSYGSLYPMLKKLEDRGLVSRSAQSREEGPDRVIYRITPGGEERLMQLLTETGTQAEIGFHNEFLLRVAFFHFLSRDQRLAVLNSYRDLTAAKFDQISAGYGKVIAGQNRYRREILAYIGEKLKNDLLWLERLIAGEREDL